MNEQSVWRALVVLIYAFSAGISLMCILVLVAIVKSLAT
jgi:hypothetical protein